MSNLKNHNEYEDISFFHFISLIIPIVGILFIVLSSQRGTYVATTILGIIINAFTGLGLLSGVLSLLF